MIIQGVAHRGYPKKYPENTLSSFLKAVELGFTHLELDVHLSKDGIPVVIHDHTVDRMTNVTGRVADYSASELQSFHIKQDEHIPTLEEVLRALKGKIGLNIELKQMGAYYPHLEEKVLEVIKEFNMLDQVVITSFDFDALERIRQLSSEVRIGLITFGCSKAILDWSVEMGATFLSMHYAFVTEHYIHRCQELGIQLMAWTINETSIMKKFQDYPSVWVCTDELESFRDVLELSSSV
ncbi:glycerophosphodiester phosphodiesterase [Paenibacillus illinoisensis]|uniref:Glycerophosphoryl diester phosphodiesterase n=1 Tax=Paenibacillus illinoisensis TaxID=59845 RepID=A0A2W0CNH3_9BACL|nr:glycerophosphodiester phosphodiesterase family protein [Paenibacillus illinoisensis]PYY25201.1 Glycerophosphoryl diester phosphodiesterase [Paenibacillus illinoisensis]